MSSFSRFQDINQKRGIANQKSNGSFIFKGYPTISITGTSNETVTASVVNRQEKDSAYIYTQKDTPLKVGSVWSAKGLHWLISEEIVIIKDVSWNKYTAILCNVEIDGLWGYFLSPEKSYINVALKQEVLLQSQQKPILVLGEDRLNINDKFMVKDRAWMVQEKDNFDPTGITYYSLTATTISKAAAAEGVMTLNEEITTPVKSSTRQTLVVKEEPSDKTMFFIPNRKITFTTQQGYFKADTEVKIHSLKEKEVIFSIPLGVDRCCIQVKQDYKLVQYVLEREDK